MGTLRKTVSANLGEVADKDLMEYFSKMNKKGVNDSKLIKQAVRFYRDNCSKVAQLNEIDAVNLLDREDISTHIQNVVNEILKTKLAEVVPTKVYVEEVKQDINKEKHSKTKVKEVKEAKSHKTDKVKGTNISDVPHLDEEAIADYFESVVQDGTKFVVK